MADMTTSTPKKTLFISDIHLDADEPIGFNCFNNLINELDNNTDALYILGDFFEAWVGDDQRTPFNESIKALLRSVHDRQIPVFLMHGNRDFLLGKKFIKESQCTFLPDETRVMIYNTPVLLMHGDTLCTDDHDYQRARKIMRNKFLQWLFLLTPMRFRNHIANKLRAASKQATSKKSLYSMDVAQPEVERVMQQHNVRWLIHGHTHRPAFHPFSINNEDYTRIVLGAWHDKASVLVWYEDGKKELIT